MMTLPIAPPGHPADDDALDALLRGAEEAVLDKLDAAVDLDEGRARIFAASVTPDQEPVPHFLRTPATLRQAEQPATTDPAPQKSVLHPQTVSQATRGIAASPHADVAARHDRTADENADTARSQPR